METPIQPSGGWPPVTAEDTKQATMMWIIAIVLQICTGLGWLSPLIFFITSRDKSKFVGYYSAQALLSGIALFVLVVIATIAGGILTAILPPLLFFAYLVMFAGWVCFLVILILAMLKSSRGEWWEMPFVGDYAKKLAGL